MPCSLRCSSRCLSIRRSSRLPSRRPPPPCHRGRYGARHAAGRRPVEPVQRGRCRGSRRRGQERAAAHLRPEHPLRRRVRDRPGDGQGGRPLSGRPQSAARGAVVGPVDAVGREQRGRPHRREPDADRSPHRQAGRSRFRSTTRTTCISRPTGTRRSSSPKRTSAWTSAIRRPWRCSSRSRFPVAAASTTPISRSTAATRSSPASSPGAWSRSTWSPTRSWVTSTRREPACRRTSA